MRRAGGLRAAADGHCVVCLQEDVLSEQLTAIDGMLSAMDLKAKFELRKQLLLDLDSYKRKASCPHFVYFAVSCERPRLRACARTRHEPAAVMPGCPHRA